MAVELFGIRHHGPGSAKSLLSALQDYQPDLLLVEAPEELIPLLEYLDLEGLKPPLAALLYNPKELQQAVYYPFAAFSPEWQAFQWANTNGVPVWAMDLPQSLRLGLAQQPERLEALRKDEPKDPLVLEIAQDPLGYLARLAGYTDSERWWEVFFEQGRGDDASVFGAVLELMQTLRTEVGNAGQADNRIREAQMRKILRKAIKGPYDRIAVVCGAWHTPALTDLKAFSVKEDNALLKGIPKVKVKATWIPWTYDRLAFSSGYGAGVLSPAWYALLFENYDQATVQWMTLVSQLFQKEDLESSAAHAIEGVRLAETLAALRGLAMPGIDELTEAVLTIFSGGYRSQLDLVHQRLVIGDQMGEVPDAIPSIPLQQDLDQDIKRLKLKKYRSSTEALWLKANSNRPQGGLDLRQAHDLQQSQLLHRLTLLNIPWGMLGKPLGSEMSTKNEYWQLQWKPEFAIRIIEAGMWGNTVEQAATAFVTHQAQEATELRTLTELLERVLHANLGQALQVLVEALRNQAALVKDVQHLLQALPPLVRIRRYGDVRQTAVKQVDWMLSSLVPRICIGLPHACTQIDEAASAALFGQILATNRALLLLEHAAYLAQWQDSLVQLAEREGVASCLRGLSVRLLLDGQIWTVDQAAQQVRLALSKGASIEAGSQWLEGFLHGSGLLLLHNPQLWDLVNAWLVELSHAAFQQLLPALRKTFASYAPAERQKMLQLAQRGPAAIREKSVALALDAARVQEVLPVLSLIFGSASSPVGGEEA